MIASDPHRRLRRRLDSLPVGYPGGKAGMRLLRRLFSPDEARIALGMDWRFRDPGAIAGALGEIGLSAEGLESALDRMASKGSILKRATTGEYALMPFVVGMYEFQVSRLSRELVKDAGSFLYGGFALELLSSGEAQTRIIPIGAAIRTEHRIACYEEFRAIIQGAGGRIAVLPCVCRTGADLSGKPCRSTDRRELCIVFRDYADTVVREGWGRALSTEEALRIADENEREGLIMRPSNEREPQFLCACCGDCCALIAVVKAMRRPADFVSSNFRARVEGESCVGCGSCARRCPMEAISLRGRTALVQEGRCIGCGVCVPACRPGAIRLERKAAIEPPKDTESLLASLQAKRPTLAGRLLVGIKGLLGIPLARRASRGARRRARPTPPPS